jgi:hypothetical protein
MDIINKHNDNIDERKKHTMLFKLPLQMYIESRMLTVTQTIPSNNNEYDYEKLHYLKNDTNISFITKHLIGLLSGRGIINNTQRKKLNTLNDNMQTTLLAKELVTKLLIDNGITDEIITIEYEFITYN